MFLHLIDDEKFIDAVITQFENTAPGKNIYLRGYNNNNEIKFIKQTNYIISAEYNSEKYFKIIGDTTQYNAILVHYLCHNKANVVSKLPFNTVFVWMMWGSDVYELMTKGRFGKYNRSKEIEIYKLYVKNPIKILIHKISYRLSSNKLLKNKKSVITKFKYFTTVVPEEVSIIRKNLRINAKYLHFNYGNISSFIPEEIKNVNITGENILIGNSGDPNNNHIEILDKLKTFNLNQRKIIIPLSYGYKPYINNLIEKGKFYLGTSLLPLTDFLDKVSYVNILSQCSVCIMNNYRQHALGNIIIMLWLGAKVYLNECNSVYTFLTNLGVKIFSIQKDLNSTNKFVFKKLEITIAEKNRKIIEDYYSEQMVNQRTKNLVSELIK